MIAKLLPKGAFARNVITLMTGTTLAQAIPVAISPLLTRLYSPAEFGVFALYMAIVSVLAVLATGRYELAIMVPKRDRDAAAIVAVAFLCCLCISALLLVVVSVFNEPIARLFNISGHAHWLYWVPLSVMLTAAYQSLNYWCNRRAYYRRMSSTRVVQNSGMSAVHLTLGYAGFGMLGLIAGAVFGHVSAFLMLLQGVFRNDRKAFAQLTGPRIKAAARRHSDFPKFLVLAHSFNMASFQSPIFLLGTFFGSGVAGFFMLTQRVIGAPMSIVAGAIGDVFRQQASEEYSRNGECKDIYRKTFKRLLCISVVPFLVFFLIAPDFFGLVFGAQWTVSGEYARILTPMLFFQFITSPLSSMFFIAGKQRADLIWQFFLFFVVCSSLALGGYNGDVHLALVLFSIGYSVMYIVNGLMTYRFARGERILFG